MTGLERSEVNPKARDPEEKQDVRKHRFDEFLGAAEELALLRIERFSKADQNSLQQHACAKEKKLIASHIIVV